MGGTHLFLMDLGQRVYSHLQDTYKGAAVDRTLHIVLMNLQSLVPVRQLCLIQHQLYLIPLTHSVVMKLKIHQNVEKVRIPFMEEEEDFLIIYRKWNNNLKD